MQHHLRSSYKLCGLFMLTLALPEPALAETSLPKSYQKYYEAPSVSQNEGAPSPKSDYAEKKDWDIVVGAGLVVAPKYSGSSKYQISPVPNISISYQDKYFLNPLGLGVNAIKWKGFKAGASIGYDMGRNDSVAARLHGLGDIEASINAAIFASYRLENWTFDGAIRHALTHASSYGMTADLGVNYRIPVIEKRLDIVVGPRIGFADSDYMETWYGITNAQAAGSGMRVYNAEGGIKDMSFNARMNYAVAPHVKISPFVSVKRLLGDAADSPIVEEETQFMGGVGVGYRF